MAVAMLVCAGGVIAMLAVELARPGVQTALGTRWNGALIVHHWLGLAAVLGLSAVLGHAGRVRWLVWAAVLAVPLAGLAIAHMVYTAPDLSWAIVFQNPVGHYALLRSPYVWAASYVLPLALLWLCLGSVLVRHWAQPHVRAAILSLGLIGVVWSLLLLGYLQIPSALRGAVTSTTYRSGLLHLPGFALIVGPVIWAALHANPRFGPWIAWLVHALLGLCAIIWGLAMIVSGRMGMPSRFPDYPIAFGFWQGVAATAALTALALCTLYVALCVLRRA
ncbi:MAG: hypothetical protein AAFY38_01490 [Pseudomonadota bacterium]